ncbi:MAG: AbrB/MazE/SpoVT family DNA-binding domain-containing protein [Actinomycetota bacterium]
MDSPWPTRASTLSAVWYDSRMAHKDQYVVRLGDRGRLVLPAELRRLAGLREGEELVAVYRDGVLRLASRRELARAGRGMFAHVGSGRDLIGELLAERRQEARRENGGAEARKPRRR